MEHAMLTAEQGAAFERDGFLIVPGALPPAMVERLLGVVDRLYGKGLREEGLSKTNRWHMRNCIVADPVFIEVLDWPATFPLAVDLLNWNIHLITSHLIVRAPSPPEADASWKAEGWHRDGGTSAKEMQEPHPRLFLKIAAPARAASLWPCASAASAGTQLTDLSEPGRGSIRCVPGSHRLVGPPAQADGAPDPYGAIEVRARPGDAVLFEQPGTRRTPSEREAAGGCWHAVGPNTSELTRKSLFFGYGYRWLRPMDYVVMPPELLARCTPIRRQLLGDATTQLGYYLPQDEDVPLRAWCQAREAERQAPGH
jgi:ectoine hydroxylase